VLVASGTASLECALLEKPMCIIYKASLISYIAAMKLIKVKYLGLCNLLMGNMVVPELLQYDCSAKELTKTALELLQNTDVRKKMLSRLYDLKIQLSSQAADCTIGELIFREL
jgi:lipid-A-disaccharide synthase